MLIIRLVMVHMGPKHTQYGQKTARLAPVLQNGLKGHVRPPMVRESHTPPWVRPSRKGLLGTFLSKTVQVGVSWHLSHSEVQDGVS